MNETTIRDHHHWEMEDYRQRITSSQWKQLLLNNEDLMIFRGRRRKLKAQTLYPGVVEISKVPLKSEEGI